MVKAPIWRDTEYTVTAQSGELEQLNYYIECSGDTIFQGKAVPAPAATAMSININRICENYLSNDIPTQGRDIHYGTYQSNPEAYKEFKLYNDNGVLLETYRFLYNWEYDYDISFNDDINLSRAINGHYAPNMYLMASYWESSNNGYVMNNIALDPDDVTFEDEPIYTVSVCANYALYYLNRAGGWDSFAIEGMVKKRDKYEKYYTNTAFNNKTLDFERKAYHNQITTAYELHTGWLNDKESERLAYHLLASNKVYFQNLCTGEVVPVILTDAEAEYKTHKTEGRKMANYTINIEESQLKQNL